MASFVLRPVTDAASSWAPAGNCAAQIQEVDPDGDVTHCSAVLPGEFFLCNFGSLALQSWPRPMRISGLRLVAWVKTTGLAGSDLAFRLSKLNHQYDSPTQHVSTPFYTEIDWLLPQQPDGAAWTATALAAALTEPDGSLTAGLVFVGGDECWCTTFAAYVLAEPYPQWTLVSRANGTVQQWAGVPATAPAYLALQEYNGDESYITSSVGGDVSLFPPEVMGTPFPTNIDTVRVTALVKNESAVAHTVTPLLRLGGADYRGGCDTLGAQVQPSDTWQLIYNEYIADPSTAWPAGNPAGTAWTLAQTNAIEMGLENTSGGEIRCTSLATEVWLAPTPLTTINLFPIMNGFYQTDFIPIAPPPPALAWENVDEDPPDDATSYIEASATSMGTPQYCSFSIDAAEVIAVAAGNAHTVVLKRDGTVWCWGANGSGQLGIGTVVTPSLVPVQVLDASGSGPLLDVVAVAAGDSHTVALKADGTVWCWGANGSGQLGNNSIVSPQALPVQVIGMWGIGFLTGIVEVSAGAYHTMARSAAGGGANVYCWGLNSSGQLGNGGFATPQTTPMQVGGGAIDIISIAGGGAHSLAAKNDGSVWSWGRNVEGQLGDNTIVGPKPAPVQVVGTGGIGFLTDVAEVATGARHSVARLNAGTVWCWGFNSSGQVGNGGFVTPQITPQQAGALADIVRIAAGYNHTVAVNSTDNVWCWGFGTNGELGDNTGATSNIPVQTLDPVGVGLLLDISGIAGGASHTVAMSNSGFIYCWGSNADGQLSDPLLQPFSWLPLVSVVTAVPADQRIYSVELRCRVRLGNLPGSTAVVAPVVRWLGGLPNETYVGKPVTIESTAGLWFDVKWDFYVSPYTGARWAGLASVLQNEWGLVVLEGDVLLSRVRVRVCTCRDYPAAGVPSTINLQLTNLSQFYMARSILDGTLYAVTEFSVGAGGYDFLNPGTVTAITGAEVALSSEVYRGPLTHLQYSTTQPPPPNVPPFLPWNVQYWCRVPRDLAMQGIGEVGLWAKILWSPFPWEIGTFFLFALQHQPCQVRHRDSVGLYVLQVDYV